ncbi:MAG: DUF2752 domain-containing protein [Desulfomonilaceae bacterium]
MPEENGLSKANLERMSKSAEHNFGLTGPLSRQRGRIEHLWILGFSLVAISGAYILDLSSEGAVIFSSDRFGCRFQLPETCMSRRIFGVSCPGCGLTRSFVAVAHGNIRMGINANIMGPMLYLLCWLQIPYRIFRYFGWGMSLEARPQLSRAVDLIIWILLIGLVSTWILRLAVEIIP